MLEAENSLVSFESMLFRYRTLKSKKSHPYVDLAARLNRLSILRLSGDKIKAIFIIGGFYIGDVLTWL